MPSKFYNIARMGTSTVGTDTLTLSSAVPGYLSFANAGISNGDQISYTIFDGISTEVGRGIYSSSGSTLTRNVIKSTNSNLLLNLSGNAHVIITALAEDFAELSLNSFRNLLRNSTFSINQRAVSGMVTLAAGAYGHDGVKAGANGATYTFAANGIDTTLTLSTGSLILPIESVMLAGGDYVLTHEGSAQARVWQGTGVSGTGAYVTASRSNGLVVAGLTAATQTNIEFIGGSILRPQFEAGGIVTQFERRTPDTDLAFCQRYLYVNQLAGALGMAVGPTDLLFGVAYPVTLRATPTVKLLKVSVSSGLYDLLVGSTWVDATGLGLGGANISATGGLVKVNGFSGLTTQTLCMGNGLASFCSFSAEI